jgi:hypothetical protein|tara:strand:- start:1206 stop:1469 length:264 start_codon:yes stop_codon:yes gene_type:complete
MNYFNRRRLTLKKLADRVTMLELEASPPELTIGKKVYSRFWNSVEMVEILEGKLLELRIEDNEWKAFVYTTENSIQELTAKYLHHKK